jgi:hypothetical protein
LHGTPTQAVLDHNEATFNMELEKFMRHTLGNKHQPQRRWGQRPLLEPPTAEGKLREPSSCGVLLGENDDDDVDCVSQIPFAIPFTSLNY